MSDTQLKEADIYLALEKHFAGLGYKVQGEVVGCDLVAKKDDELVVVELKKTFNVKVLYQAVRRLSITDQVYVAVLAPQSRQKMAYWQMIKSLARRLTIGVFIVGGKNADQVKLLVEPGPFKNTVSAQKRKKLLAEFDGRRVSKNAGGVTGTKLKTAYLENAVHICVLLQKHKQLSAAQLKELGCSEATYRTLYNNHYGWFKKLEQGVYGLKMGQAALVKKKYPEIWAYYHKLSKAGGGKAKKPK